MYLVLLMHRETIRKDEVVYDQWHVFHKQRAANQEEVRTIIHAVTLFKLGYMDTPSTTEVMDRLNKAIGLRSDDMLEQVSDIPIFINSECQFNIIPLTGL